MQLDFDVQRCTRRCAATHRELKPGDCFYSVLVADGANILRYDYCAEAWKGAPEDAIGWWQSHVADPQTGLPGWAPHDVILQYFAKLADCGEADLRYVLALLLVRKRIARLEETEVGEDGRESLVLYCVRNETEYRVPVVEPTLERAREIQQQLVQLLFANTP